jgi:hypothetical protein
VRVGLRIVARVGGEKISQLALNGGGVGDNFHSLFFIGGAAYL